jgi:flavodoxin
MVHTKTGTTLKFGKSIATALEQNKHSVDFVELKTDQPVNSNAPGKPVSFKITNMPTDKEYDIYLVGSPVWGGQPTPVAIEAIKQLKGLAGKKFVPFVTHSFPFASWGGTQSLAKLSKTAKEQNALTLEGVSIERMFRNLDIQIENGVKKILSIVK